MNDYRESHIGKAADYDEYIETPGFDAFMAEQECRVLRQLAVDLFPGSIGSYLDFACGTGRILSQVAEFANNVTAVDISESMIELAAQKCPKAKFIVGDITGDKKVQGSFDLITSFRFFGNAQDELRLSVLKALNDLLSDTGVLIINNHRNPGSVRERLSAFQGDSKGMDLTMGKLSGMLRETGFRIEKRIPIGAWMIRHKYSKPEIYNSALGRKLEKISSLLVPSSLAPDAVIVARKCASRS